VWCGAYDGALAATSSSHARIVTRLEDGQRFGHSRGTFSVGCFAFQVVTYDSHALPASGIWIPDMDPAFRDTMFLFWPLLSADGLGVVTRWPPGSRLDTRRLLALRTRRVILDRRRNW
jgi:hypothetical protein